MVFVPCIGRMSRNRYQHIHNLLRCFCVLWAAATSWRVGLLNHARARLHTLHLNQIPRYSGLYTPEPSGSKARHVQMNECIIEAQRAYLRCLPCALPIWQACSIL